jgi:hypothetical protein
LLEDGDAEEIPQQISLAARKKVPAIPRETNQSVRENNPLAGEQEQLLERPGDGLGSELCGVFVPSMWEYTY